MAHRKSDTNDLSRYSASELVERYLGLADAPDRIAEQLGPLSLAFGEKGKAILQPLQRALETKTGRPQLMAARYLLNVATETTLVPLRVTRRARELFLAALQTGSDDDKLWVCTQLSMGVVPHELHRALGELLASQDEGLRVLAAAALANTRTENADWFRVLRAALKSLRGELVVVAASAMVACGAHEQEAVAALVNAIADRDAPNRLKLLIAAKSLGPKAIAAAATLNTVVESADEAPLMRSTAAEALGYVTKGTTVAYPSLLMALQSRQAEVIRGATDAFDTLGVFPPEALGTFTDLLPDPDEELRLAGAVGLAYMGKVAAGATQPLIERIGLESSPRVSDALAAALGAIGTVAAGPLIDIIRDLDMRRMPLASIALFHMGADGVNAIIDAARAEPHRAVYSVLVSTLRDSGSLVRHVVPQLVDLLDDTDDEEIADYLVQAIELAGPEAAPAVPALSRWLGKATSEFHWRIERALINIGPLAIPQVSKASESASGRDKERLLAVLARLGGAGRTEDAALDSVPTESLRTFLWVADILIDGPASLAQMVKRLLERQRRGEIPADADISDGTLRNYVRDVEKALGFKLSDRPKGVRTSISAAGLQAAARVRRYLEEKNARGSVADGH